MKPVQHDLQDDKHWLHLTIPRATLKLCLPWMDIVFKHALGVAAIEALEGFGEILN